MKNQRVVGFRFGLVAFAALLASGYKEVPPPEHVVLPAARSPQESLASIKVPADLQVELVAAEPLVMDPIDVTWDAAGRMWVVEMADYPNGIDGKGKPGGRIRFLESTRGDGNYDKSTLFADGLSFPTSVRPWRKGVIVTAIPDIWYLEDTDGDGRADRREKLFTGLAEGNQQHLANGLQWGLDGWLYLGNGNSGGKIASAKGGAAIDVGQRDFRIQPDEGLVDVLAGQSQYGRNRNDWGDWFGCNNSNPIWHYALEEHYLRRNPHLVPPSPTVTVSITPGASPVFPRSETLARFNDPQGHNHFTSACGVMIYRDDFLGAGYAGNVFVCEPVHNLVHREIVRPAGATFTSQRAPAEEKSEFFASSDNWSRFTSVRAGPDGALYIVDMYRLVIEHPKWIPDAWQQQLGDLRAGEKQGRIYRVRPKGSALRPMPRLASADVNVVVAALENPSGTVRDLAQQQIAWRADKSAGAALERLMENSPRPETRAQALWTLHSVGALTADVVDGALRDAHAGVRRQAVRLSEEFTSSNPELLKPLVALASDGNAMVRQQLAYTLGEWKLPAAGEALAKLLGVADDRFIRAAIMSSMVPHADTVVARLSPDDPALMEIAAATENARALSSLLTRIAAPNGAMDRTQQLDALGQLLDWLQRNNKSLAQLSSAVADVSMLNAIDLVFGAAREITGNPDAPVTQRIAAAKILGRGRARQNEDVELLGRVLVPQSPVELQLAAVASLARLNRANVPDRLLANWAGYGRNVRAAVLDAVLARPAWAQVLLDRVEADRAMAAQIDPGRRAALLQHNNAKLAERAKAVFAASADSDRQKVVDRYLVAIEPLHGDATKGAAVFGQICSACHKFGDVPGHLVGPDLATVNDRSRTYLVTHILDPNRAVEDRYVLYSATLQDGRTLAGMLARESGSSLTLLGLDGTEQTVLRSELKSLSSTGRSLMPDGLEAAIDEQAMADLVAFLGGEKNSSK